MYVYVYIHVLFVENRAQAPTFTIEIAILI